MEGSTAALEGNVADNPFFVELIGEALDDIGSPLPRELPLPDDKPHWRYMAPENYERLARQVKSPVLSAALLMYAEQARTRREAHPGGPEAYDAAYLKAMAWEPRPAEPPTRPNSYPTVHQEQPPPPAVQQELPRPFLPAVVEALSPKEAKVHRALVNGPRTRQDIERQTGLPSTTVRSCLTSLELRGMVRKYGSGTKEEPYTYGYAQTGP